MFETIILMDFELVKLAYLSTTRKLSNSHPRKRCSKVQRDQDRHVAVVWHFSAHVPCHDELPLDGLYHSEKTASMPANTHDASMQSSDDASAGFGACSMSMYASCQHMMLENLDMEIHVDLPRLAIHAFAAA